MSGTGSPGHPPAWLDGLFAVIPTPMRDGGAVDLDGLERVVEYYLDHGARGVVPASIAGEGQLLSQDEQRAVLARVVRCCEGHAPVLLGVLGEQAAQAAELARVAADQGAWGLLLKPPQVAPDAALDHIGTVAQAARVPLVLIDHPQFGASPSPALLSQWTACIPQVCGIKLEAEPTPAKMAEVAALLGPRLRIFGGLGAVHGLDELAHGAQGFFTGHPQPQHLVALIERFRAGDMAGARAAYDALLQVAQWERANPQHMVASRKARLRDLGVIAEAVTRLP